MRWSFFLCAADLASAAGAVFLGAAGRNSKSLTAPGEAGGAEGEL
jgi:hypothetical protein